MSKKTACAAVLLAAFTLSACSSGAPNNEPSTNDGDTTLTMWVYNADYQSLIEDYEALHDDLSIDVISREKDDHQLSLFTALSAGGGAPDVAAIDWDELDTYLDAPHQFVNLADHGAEEQRDSTLDWAFDAGSRSDGSFILGVPATVSPSVLHYHVATFEEAGLPTEPEDVSEALPSWAAFMDAADDILNETGAAMTGNPDMIYHAKRDQLDDGYFNEDGELLIGEHSHVETIFMETAEWMEEGYLLLYDQDSEDWQNAIRDGAFATVLGGRTVTENLKQDIPDDGEWRMTQIPEGSGNRGGSWLAVPEQSDHPEEAYALIEWLTAPAQQLQLYEQEGIFPASTDVYEDDAFAGITDPFFGNQATGLVLAEAARRADPHFRGRNYNSVDEEILIGLDDVFLGTPPDEEWAAILERVERRISR